MLNKRFEQSVQKAVGDEVFAALKKSDAYCTAIRYFDLTIKLGFRGKQDPCRYVQFPMANLKDNKAWGLERDAMALSG
jgi:hypothetical protein